MESPKILALIPARSGSKAVPDKNVRTVAGKPMLAHSIEQAHACELISRCVVSTDSERYATVAKGYGAEVPFLRPEELSRDLSTDLEAFTHALAWLKDNEGYEPDICVHLRPTFPTRDVADISAMIEILLDNPELDSVRSIVPAHETPYKMWHREDGGRITAVVDGADLPLSEPFNLPRQMLPQTYSQNACIDVLRTRVVTELRSMTGPNIHGYLMSAFEDVDTPADLAGTQKVARGPLGSEPRTFCFDIDGCIATITPHLDYEKAEPIRSTIDHINTLYDAGHQIVLFTARGSVSGIDWMTTTEEQMKKWGVKHHELRLGKPAADYYIDDKMIALEDLDDFVGGSNH
jgi:CMP-N,N'-diacetyllegionaminic acid synthase